MIYISFIINKKTRWCFDEILIPAPSPTTFTQFVHALMEQDFGELAMQKPPYSQAFFPFRPNSVHRNYVELFNDIIFDMPSLIGIPRTRNTEAMIRAINHPLYKMRKLSKIIG
jgi:hypothetical protein